MPTRRGYLLCGTPRTGSTLLCSLLTSTGLLGRPESYFRGPDETAWAGRLGLPTDGPLVRDHPGRQADDVNAEWAAALRAALDG